MQMSRWKDGKKKKRLHMFDACIIKNKKLKTHLNWLIFYGQYFESFRVIQSSFKDIIVIEYSCDDSQCLRFFYRLFDHLMILV